MVIIDKIKELFKEEPIDDSLCGLNKKHYIDDEVNIDDYIERETIVLEKTDFHKEIEDSIHRQEREMYLQLRKESKNRK